MQNTKLIKKISTSLVSTGEIIDSLQSNSSTNAPSIRAVVDNMTPPMNLLINGDFKINQRGQTSYTATYKKYTVDDWYIYNGTLNVIDKGISVLRKSNSEKMWIGQYVKSSTNTFTLVSKVNGSVYYHTFENVNEYQTIEYEGFQFSAQLNSGNIYLIQFGANVDTQFNIEYIDLFEGTIAYQHIPEDDAIALMRCMSKIQSLVDFNIGGRLILFLTNGSNILQGIQYFMPMDSVPTVESIEIMYSNGQSATGITATPTKNEITRIDISDSSLFKNSYAYLNKLIVTCEPL